MTEPPRRRVERVKLEISATVCLSPLSLARTRSVLLLVVFVSLIVGVVFWEPHRLLELGERR